MLEKITVLELHLDAPLFGTDDAGTEHENGDSGAESEGPSAGKQSSAPENRSGSTEPELEDVGAVDRDAREGADTRTVDDRAGSRPDGEGVDRGGDSGSLNRRLVGMAIASLVVSALVTVLAYRLFGGEEESDAVDPDERVRGGGR